MTKTQAKRLLKLADYLEAFKEPAAPGPGAVGFDMRTVFADDPRHIDEERADWLAMHPCGTAACVLGHAGLMPEFQKLGLITDCAEGGRVILNGKRVDMEKAGVQFFGLSVDDACDLFLDGFEKTPRRKAADIRAIVRHHRLKSAASS